MTAHVHDLLIGLLPLQIVLATLCAMGTLAAVDAYRARPMTEAQRWTLGLPLFLLWPLVALAWLGLGLALALRMVGRGAVEWYREVRPGRTSRAPDVFTAAAEQEVERLLEPPFPGVRPP